MEGLPQILPDTRKFILTATHEEISKIGGNPDHLYNQFITFVKMNGFSIQVQQNQEQLTIIGERQC
jgi:hypothetical protein